MNSLLYYYNNVQKMAAYRQAKRMQRGALTAQGGFSTTDPSLFQLPCTIQCVFSPETFEETQTVFIVSSGTYAPRINVDTDGTIQLYYGFSSKRISAEIGVVYNVTFVVTASHTDAYLGGDFIGGEDRDIIFQDYIIGSLPNKTTRFQGDYLMHRHFNYAMSADEVKALDNNGDPVGYVVPKAMRGDILGYNSDFSADTDGVQPSSSTTTVSVENGWLVANRESPNEIWLKITKLPNDELIRIYSLRIIVESNESITAIRFSPYVTGAGSVVSVSQGTDLGDGTTLYCVNAPILSSSLQKFNLCQVGIIGQLTSVRIKSIEITGGIILAEYLPQNLMESRKGPEVEPLAETFEMNMGDVNYKRVIAIDYPPYSSVYRVDYIVDEWDCTPAPIDYVGFGFSFSAKVLGGAYKWQTLEAAKIGEVQSFIFSAPSGNRPEVGLYAALDEEGAITRHLKVTIKEITPVSVPISWLDSAKQLPLSDEYMEPLFQSIGGYDMASNGAPEILYRTYDYRGVKLGYNSTVEQNVTKFQSLLINIGTNDFSIEFFGNTYGSEGGYKSTMASSNAQPYSKGSLFIYRSVLGTNGVSWVIFERPSSGEATDDSLEVNWKANGEQEKFHLIITRQGTTIKAYINDELKATKEQSEVKDMGDLRLAIANSSDVGFVRVWNKCLSDSEVSQLENSGDPAGYVLPAEMKTGDQRCIAEYLAINLVPQKYKPTVAARWLDSATVLPDPDGTLRRIWKSVGGYDMTANGNPIILQ